MNWLYTSRSVRAVRLLVLVTGVCHLVVFAHTDSYWSAALFLLCVVCIGLLTATLRVYKRIGRE